MNPVRDNKAYYVYIIQSIKDKKWYTGFTYDLRKRFIEHNNQKVYSTKNRGPFTLVYYEMCRNERDSRAREKYLKTGMGPVRSHPNGFVKIIYE